jgi:hypothetical protein
MPHAPRHPSRLLHINAVGQLVEKVFAKFEQGRPLLKLVGQGMEGPK